MLEYKLFGNDKSRDYIILLHGIGGSSSIFYKQIKALRDSYNIVAIHLPGHKKSPSTVSYNKPFSFEVAAKEVVRVLDELHIKKAHFIGISLGSVIIHSILSKSPERVKTAVLGGVITKLTLGSKFLLTLGRMMKNVTPHIWLYSLFAHILMPKQNHKESRNAFIREAKSMKREEFLGWYNLVQFIRSTMNGIKENASSVPKLYITGEEDHMFKKGLKSDIKHLANAELVILERSGHVVNIDKPEEFNANVIAFIQKNRGGLNSNKLLTTSM
ncbi:alpha/beta fold hydrolase [Pontibacillus yanchengensis]|uniref:2-succinyl-6-hydroxy-2, 4-cyclohexadiene-1-carboxylate synthase n=1 Tax=Pontibacillus yanchengensis Y32 TaxID=1385514 RepID=A0A0A2TE31_9BACI|nr:alpha/beta hydrolase [Pontibacillus yanchengensis]KGP72683.1 2-succinyl-6-hydroxy-2,4-cyclohexadiene-1-carboxylate synthase [Pontibacillus yanchengensis Y32]